MFTTSCLLPSCQLFGARKNKFWQHGGVWMEQILVKQAAITMTKYSELSIKQSSLAASLPYRERGVIGWLSDLNTSDHFLEIFEQLPSLRDSKNLCQEYRSCSGGSRLDTPLRNHVVLSFNWSPMCTLIAIKYVYLFLYFLRESGGLSNWPSVQTASSGTLSHGGYCLFPPCLRPLFPHSPIHLSLHFHLSLSLSLFFCGYSLG